MSIPTRKEAVTQMLENKNRILSRDIDNLLDIVADEIQIAINKGLGYTTIELQGISAEAISSLRIYLKSKGYHLTFYFGRVISCTDKRDPKLKIQWDLPWWRRVL